MAQLAYIIPPRTSLRILIKPVIYLMQCNDLPGARAGSFQTAKQTGPAWPPCPAACRFPSAAPSVGFGQQAHPGLHHTSTAELKVLPCHGGVPSPANATCRIACARAACIHHQREMLAACTRPHARPAPSPPPPGAWRRGSHHKRTYQHSSSCTRPVYRLPTLLAFSLHAIRPAVPALPCSRTPAPRRTHASLPVSVLPLPGL